MHHHFASDADSLRAFKELLVSQVKAKHDFYSVLDLLISVRPEFAESPERVRILLDLLRSLREEGILDFPSSKSAYQNNGSEQVPRWIRLKPANIERPEVRQPAEISWVPELAFASQLTHRKQIEVALKINDFLIEHREKPLPVVPLRERSLQLFNDEKFLDSLVYRGTMFGGKLPIDRIFAMEVPHFLVHERFASTGPLLIVENHHTYWSMCQWNQSAQRFSAVIYGAGRFLCGAESGIDRVAEVSGASRLEYFGDIDFAGFEIPLSINDYRKKTGRELLSSCGDFYLYAVRHGVPGIDNSSKTRKVESKSFLSSAGNFLVMNWGLNAYRS